MWWRLGMFLYHLTLSRAAGIQVIFATLGMLQDYTIHCWPKLT